MNIVEIFTLDLRFKQLFSKDTSDINLTLQLLLLFYYRFLSLCIYIYIWRNWDQVEYITLFRKYLKESIVLRVNAN